jgi:hypothetical protein
MNLRPTAQYYTFTVETPVLRPHFVPVHLSLHCFSDLRTIIGQEWRCPKRYATLVKHQVAGYVLYSEDSRWEDVIPAAAAAR